MSVVDRLRHLDPSTPEIDVDAWYGRLRQRVHRRRQRRRVVAGAVAAVALLLAVGQLTTAADRATEVDTAGDAHTGPARPHLPDTVPDGFDLAWVDVYEDASGSVWTERSIAAFALGYQSGGRELEVRVFPGTSVDVDAVRRAWGDAMDVVADEHGREVVTNGPRGETSTLVAFDGGVAMVLPYRAEPADPVPFGQQVALARSLRPVPSDEWASAIADADVAPPMGVRSTETLVVGDGWQLEGQWIRPPAAVTHATLAIRTDGTSAIVDDAGPVAHDWEGLHDFIDASLLRYDGHTIAWGAAPADTATVRLAFAETTITTAAVPYAGAAVFAVEVGDVADGPRSVEAVGRDGQVLAAVVDARAG